MDSIPTPAPEADGQITAPEQQPTGDTQKRPPTRLIVLVRHGQTTYNIEGRLPGQLPGNPLTDEGRRQAHRAAVALAAMPLSAILASPLERAKDTAEIIARGWDLPVRLDGRLMDTDVRRWAGMKIDEVAKSDPAWRAFLERPTEPPDDVESLSEVQARAVAVVEDIRRDPELGNFVVVVAHADVVKLILAHYTGVPLHGARHLAIANASISALAFTGDQPAELLAMNWTPAPGWLVPPLPKPKAPAEAEAARQGAGAGASPDGVAKLEPAPAAQAEPDADTQARDTVAASEP
jgi:probable phosphoglycerate mutase